MLTETRREVATPTTRFDFWWIVAVAGVLISVAATSVFAPDLVTGAAQEHVPLAGMMVWFWGLIAVAYLSFVRDERADATLGLSVAVLWAAVAVIAIAAPEMVTGTDPTRVPIAAILAPVIGCLGTGFLSLHALRQSEGR